MAGTRADNLKQFTVTSVEELDEAKEMGRGCYGAVFRVRLHGLPCIAKRLHDILVGRGRELIRTHTHTLSTVCNKLQTQGNMSYSSRSAISSLHKLPQALRKMGYNS